MTNGVILVDFDNAFFGDELSVEKVLYRWKLFVDECLSAHPDSELIEIRLYGGWKSNSNYTQRADIVRSYMERINSTLFPLIRDGRRILGNVRVVTSQYNLDVEWNDTLQEKHGRHFLKVKTTPGKVCRNDPQKCPVHLIANATRGEEVLCPIDGCEQIDVNQLIRMEQKMVDSMMTCDILEYVQEPDCRVIEVVSDDVDLHPAMALAGNKYASRNHCTLLLLVRNVRKSQHYTQILSPHNVKICNWQ